MALAAATDGRNPLDMAARLLANGRTGEARALAGGVLAARPRTPDAHRILGLCLQQEGDFAGAEAAFRTGLKLERGHAGLAVCLADLLDSAARPGDAERVLRTALEANRRSALLAARLARSLTATGRAEEAQRLTAKLAAEHAPDHAVLTEHAAALKALGQTAKALAVHERAAALFPDSPVAHHNLAADRGDLGQFAGAEQSAARALAKGGSAPQTWLVYGRALLGLNRLDEAERAFREAVRRNPAYVEAHRDLAQLIWMRSEDAGAAIATLDEAIAAHPQLHPLFAIRANLLRHAGALEAALTTLRQAMRLHPDQPGLQMPAAELAALCGDPPAALAYAEQAVARVPDDDAAHAALFAACVAAGDAGRAAGIAEGLVQRRPRDQRALAYQALAWRLTGDPRYAALYDYGAFVRAWQMDVPQGWSSLPAYLADLAEALGGLHAFRTHPLDQSLRHGSQTTHLLTSENPVIRAFFQAVDGPIRRHLAALGRDADPLRARNIGGYRFHGAWSVAVAGGGVSYGSHPTRKAGCPPPATSPCRRKAPNRPRCARPGSSSANPACPRRHPSRQNISSSRNQACWCCSPPICGTARCLSAAWCRG